VDTDRFSPRPVNGIRQQLGLGPADRVVGMVATFKRQKNHAMFFRVAARVVAEHPNTWFVCVGEPLRDGQQEADAYHREMVELIRALGVRERCLLLGARRDVPDLYNLFDVALLTSEREGTPNALLEAMASGVPVVVTDVADNAIHVADGVTGFVVPLGDVAAMTTRVNALLGDCTRRRAMGRAGRAHVCERYSLATMADRMGAVYELALGRTRPSPVREQGS
jgi:glycosyltransferase involved in cell wall biosynthesis